MSFIAEPITGTTFEAGFFLVDDEGCLRLTKTIAADHAQKVVRNGRTIVPAGAVIPANGSTAVGLLYEDIDVTEGAAPGSVVVEGTVYGDRLPAALESAAASALTRIKVLTSPSIVRPTVFGKWVDLSVASEEGTAQGDTKLTVTGYTLGAGESYVYKTGASAAPAVDLGADLTGWTAWDGSSDVTATTGHKITVAVKGADGTAAAGGSATVASKA